jgi:tetratricopeptide (TPR) repeat protein
MKISLFIFIIAIMPIIGKGQKQACPEFSPWEKLMKKENYEEANRIARLVYDYKTPDSWEKKDVRIHHDYHDLFNRNKNYLCARYYMAEPYRIMGNLRKAVEIFSNDYRDEYAGDEGFMLHKFIHYCIELGEKELALGNLDLALPPLEWAAKVGPLKIGDCTGYPIEQSKITHSYALTELIGDVWFKKEKYETALKYYEAFDTSKFSSQISTKINTAKSSLVIAKTNITEIENQTKLQSQKDETTLPVKFNPANKRIAGLVATGNISIKINSANEALSQKQIEQWEE